MKGIDKLLGVVALIALWWLLSAIVSRPLLPSPLKVAQNISSIFFQSIFVHMTHSLFRILLSLVLAIIVGLPLGVMMGYFPHAERVLAPIVYLAYPVPKIALLPIVMLALGVGDASKIVILFLIVFFQIVIAVRDAIHAIPDETFYPLLSLGASFCDIFVNVLWPASLPKFFTSLRVAMATAISVLFFTETFGTIHGMGYFIMDAWLRVSYVEMYSGIVVLSAMGLALFMMIDVIEHRACRWQYVK